MYSILKDYCVTELQIKRSRFICEAFVVTSQAQARELLREQKTRYKDATHVVHAFVIGSAGEIMGCSDDGEPPGTAGKPMLEVLKGRLCTNIMVTITRYFGGILLGTGGLVKAYSDGTKQVLEMALFEPLIKTTPFSVSIAYAHYEPVKKFLQDCAVQNLAEQFETDVSLSGNIPDENIDKLNKFIIDISHGQSTVHTKNKGRLPLSTLSSASGR